MRRSSEELIRDRERLLGPNVPTFYTEPVHVVMGEGVWLWDADGRRYLDCYNNVPHVGHCNPRVVDAICRQAGTLNTHTRYLHDTILDYVERLTGTMDAALNTAIMTCTGSEANDIALRMAEAVTGRRGIIATDATYHGNTALVSQLSRSNVPSVGFGLDQFFRFVPAPDSYRDPDPDGTRFADAVAEKIDELNKTDSGFAALVICPFFLNEGFPDHRDGWLKPVAQTVRKAGGLLICDEVQSGFGRTGTHFWAHQKMGVVPDIVTLGKPMANGHPVGGVATGAETMKAFRSAFRYFNTFGGNPVSCAAAMAVLDEMEDNNLMANAKTVGEHARARLETMKRKFDCIGDVRGSGMVFGAEMVADRDSKAPAGEFTDRVINEMRARHPSFQAGTPQEHAENPPSDAVLHRQRRPSVRHAGGGSGASTVDRMNAVVEGALALWGMDGATTALIAARENQVYRVDHEGRAYALRLHRQGYRSNRELWSELQWMDAVSRGGIQVPTPIASASGEFLHVVDGIQIDVLSWLSGRPMGRTGEALEVADREGLFRNLGREMARLHQVCDRWPLPQGFTRCAWDRQGLVGAAPLWGRFWDNPALSPADRRLFAAFRRAANAHLTRENVMIDGGDLKFIDFDDGGFGFRLFDLATTLVKNLREPDYHALRAALLEGYRQVRAIDTGPLDLFIVLRSATYVGWIMTRMDETDSDIRSERFIGTTRILADGYLINRGDVSVR